MGVIGVIVLYLGVNFVCVRALGAQGLAASTVPASAVMRMAMGDTGARLIALGIAVSTLGFLSQSVLTAPRVYFAMASDGLFFEAVARVNEKSHVPVLAIVMQSVLTLVIALSGSYEKILNYVVSMDFIFFGLTGASLFVFRSREVKPLHLQTAESAAIACPGIHIRRLVRRDLLAGGGQHDLQISREYAYWEWDSCAGCAGVCVLGAAQEGESRRNSNADHVAHGFALHGVRQAVAPTRSTTWLPAE